MVVLDGVILLGGLQRLEEVPLHTVDSIAVMRSVDAVARFGPKASAGAVVVVTVVPGPRRTVQGAGAMTALPMACR